MSETSTESAGVVGRGLRRVDAEQKVRGGARYSDDLRIPGCWHGHVVRSTVAHGKLKGLRFDEDFDWSQVVVATPEDIPGPNVFVMHDRSMPVLAEDEIMYMGEPLAVVAAPTRKLAREAAAHIHADVEELPAVLTLDEVVDCFKRGGEGNVVLSEQTIRKGDMGKGFSEADEIVEGEYSAGYQEQLYIEPQGMIAEPQEDGGLFVHGSMQCPYYVVNEAHEALGIPKEKLRVKQEGVGGAFGGKEEFPSQMAAYCALPALKANRPVKIVYERNEDMLFTTKRHPSWVRYKTGVKKDGTITAIHVDYILNGGAYLTLSDVVMYRGILHVAMGYRCENIFVNGLVLQTHAFPSGAFRGFGAPQAIWGIESHVDELARVCGMAPHVFRRKNCLQEGDTTPTGQVLMGSCGSPAVLDEALERTRFEEKLSLCTHGSPDSAKWYGVGLSFFAHGAGFTGDGEAKIKSRSAVELGREGDDPVVNIRVSSTEMGQGAHTALSQIAADALSLPMKYVRYPFADTSLVPDSGPTVASRTTMVVGSTVHEAALKLKKELEAFAQEEMFGGEMVRLIEGEFRSNGKTMGFADVADNCLNSRGALRTEHQFALPPGIRWNQETFEGDAYPAYSWGCNVAEVEIDPLTLELKVVRVTAVWDIGRVINPVLAKGQIEGGLTQALGYAVMERMGMRDGHVDADRMQTYIVPTSLDTPEYDIVFLEFPYEHAAPGAKGVGEIPMDGLAPAIANAVEQAAGVRICGLPITPEVLFEAMRAKR